MRRIGLVLLAATGLAGVGAVASAADLGIPVKAPAYAPPPAFSWSGGYIGGNIGGLWSRSQLDPIAQFLSGPAPGGVCASGVCGLSFQTETDSSLVGGFQSGLRWQWSSIVLGVEQDFQWADVNRSFTAAAPGPTSIGPFQTGDTFSTKLEWQSATKAQVGFAWDRFLIYATGGLQTAAMSTSAFFVGDAGVRATPALSFSNDNKYHIGWTAGGGAEWAVTNSVSIGIEGRYFDLGSETYNLGAFQGSSGRVWAASTEVDLKGWQVTGRINIKTSDLLRMFF